MIHYNDYIKLKLHKKPPKITQQLFQISKTKLFNVTPTIIQQLLGVTFRRADITTHKLFNVSTRHQWKPETDQRNSTMIQF